jgi:hypothetical protein
MYKGTLIRDLMAAVEQAEQKAEQKRADEEAELQAIFAMQIPLAEGSHVFMGAA